MGLFSPQLRQEQARQFTLSLLTHFDNPAKSRKTPTQVEVDRAEQSLLRVRADLSSKRAELASLKEREASQTEVV